MSRSKQISGGKPKQFLLALVAAFGLSMAGPVAVQAEGTSQFNEAQALSSSTVLFADITAIGETINISVCNDTNISIWNTNGTPADVSNDTAVVTAQAFTANLVCNASLPNPITTAYQYTPAAAGTYRITIDSDQERYDFSVAANASVDPDPTVSNGRIWSYKWELDTGSFGESSATDADLYVMVPASLPGQNFIWKLDLNKFSGNVYSLAANSQGLDAPYSGLSADDNVSTVTPEFPIYLGYPAAAGSVNASTPTIANARFLDDGGQDNIFSPNGTVGIQDTGDFKFDTNVNNANYAITIDTNQDGIFGTGDRLLLGKAQNGANSVNWDGNFPDGSPVGSGVYRAQIQIRTGEYHFIANDVETSGGTNNGGTSWANGLTIFRALNANTTENTKVFWDDLTEFGTNADATANVPAGVTSGSTADANSNGRADGYHTWGNFSGSSLGNSNNIDTYVYGPAVSVQTNIAVAPDELGDSDGVTSAVELGAANFGDGNGDGTEDYLQDNVSSLPNTTTGGYNTLASTGCSDLSGVAIYAENQLSASDSRYEYPAGLFNFSVNCNNPGDSATVTVYYDKVYDTSTWTARKFINGVYSNIPGAVFGTAVTGGTSVTTLTYTIKDGGPLDADGTANGTIVDPVGPGIVGTGGVTPTASIVGAPNTGLQQQHWAVPMLIIAAGVVTIASTYARAGVRSGRQ